ncbi:hypothetical protein SFUMM280S_07740 [Streptomyces fumanus]
MPKASPDSEEPGTPGLFWVSVAFLAVTGPSTPPGTTRTPFAFGTPATRSVMPSRS